MTPSASSATSRFTTPVAVPLWTALFSLICAVAVGAAALAAFTGKASTSAATPRWVQGVVTGVTGDGISVGFTEDGGQREGEGIPLAAISWIDAQGRSYGGVQPECLLPGSYGQKVELAILELSMPGDWPQKLIVGVHCLS